MLPQILGDYFSFLEGDCISVLCKCLQKGCVGAHVTISSEWRSIIEYRAPSDTMIAGSHHFSPHHVITFKCTGSFSHQLADDREHHRASLGKTPRSFSILTTVTLISHCQNPVWFVFESIYMPHREYLVVLVVLFPYSIPIANRPMNHSFISCLHLWFLNRTIYEAGMAGHCWIYYHLKQRYISSHFELF